MDYTELVKSLRLEVECAKKLYHFQGVPGYCVLLSAAADAIENLQAAVSGFEANTDVAFVKENGHEIIRFVPKWIPVTERLPDKPGDYLVCDKYDYGYGAYYNLRIVSFTKNLNKVDKYDFPGKEYKRPGWYNYDSEYRHYETGREIIAWMPLPEPPKEETE